MKTRSDLMLGIAGLVVGLVLGASAEFKEEIMSAGSCIRLTVSHGSMRNDCIKALHRSVHLI